MEPNSDHLLPKSKKIVECVFLPAQITQIAYEITPFGSFELYVELHLLMLYTSYVREIPERNLREIRENFSPCGKI